MRPEVKVVALSAPKQERETVSAKMRPPAEPKTFVPNACKEG